MYLYTPIRFPIAHRLRELGFEEPVDEDGHILTRLHLVILEPRVHGLRDADIDAHQLIDLRLRVLDGGLLALGLLRGGHEGVTVVRHTSSPSR
ncbi:Uncharacterised protein [Tyzzerella nexilis]|uniref:Uncharacterized protein n=1 Tax=[Clostridium] nexile TaxID=29361 RepID=A0A6N2V7X9_9FIRM